MCRTPREPQDRYNWRNPRGETSRGTSGGELQLGKCVFRRNAEKFLVKKLQVRSSARGLRKFQERKTGRNPEGGTPWQALGRTGKKKLKGITFERIPVNSRRNSTVGAFGSILEESQEKNS